MDEGAEVPAVDVFVGSFACCVVAAREDLGEVVDFVAVEIGEDVERELAEEGQVVGGVDYENSFGVGGEAVHVGHGRDSGEDLADCVLGEAGVLEGFANVAGGLAGPDYVAEPGRGVVEGADLDAWVEGGGDESVATAEAGAEDAELLVALLLEPVDAAADVDDGLAAGGGGAADVGAYGVVGTL